MKKLLVLPFLLGFTSAVNAETWWLMAAGERILSGGGLSNSHVNWAIPTYSETECEIAGQKWINSKFPFEKARRGYACVKGK